MLKRLHEIASPVEFEFEGETVVAQEGESLAAALLAHGAGDFRKTPVSGAPRAPYCMIGVCFDCLVEVDGRPNRQACMTPARAGMKVRRQKGTANVKGGS